MLAVAASLGALSTHAKRSSLGCVASGAREHVLNSVLARGRPRGWAGPGLVQPWLINGAGRVTRARSSGGYVIGGPTWMRLGPLGLQSLGDKTWRRTVVLADPKGK